MTNEELEAKGLFDPENDSAQRADLLRRCLELGLTTEDIHVAGEDLITRAIDAILRGGQEQLTLAEVAERAGVQGDMAAAITRATGFAGAPASAENDSGLGLLEANVAGAAGGEVHRR